MAIKNYNPDYPFINHMNLYVKGQLYQGISDLHPLTIIPKKMRLSKKWKKENKKRELVESLNNQPFVSYFKYVQNLEFNETPNYNYLIRLLTPNL